jgi:hypothetical protein
MNFCIISGFSLVNLQIRFYYRHFHWLIWSSFGLVVIKHFEYWYSKIVQSEHYILDTVFWLAFLSHLTQRVMWAIVTTERPSSVVRRPSVNFSHFNQLLWSHWANLNQTLVEWSLDGRWSWLPTKMAAKLKIEKRGDEILIVHCCFSISQSELKF